MRFLSFLAALFLLAGCSPKRVEGTEPGDCTDDADNDADGLFDCDDPDCAGASVCENADDDIDTATDTDTDIDTDTILEGQWIAVDQIYNPDECLLLDAQTRASYFTFESYVISNASNSGFDFRFSAVQIKTHCSFTGTGFFCEELEFPAGLVPEGVELTHLVDFSGTIDEVNRGSIKLEWNTQCSGCEEWDEAEDFPDLPCDTVLSAGIEYVQ